MDLHFFVLIGTLIPLIGTTLGSAAVFFTGKRVHLLAYTGIQGFSSGVMIAASVWSLIIPAMEHSAARGRSPLALTCTGLAFGVAAFLLCGRWLRGLNLREVNVCCRKSFLPSAAIAFHNLPEGMAVGAVFAELLQTESALGLSAAMALSVGIAVQNIPEGAIVSVPLNSDGYTKPRSFLFGVLSGAVEPIGALLTVLLSEIAVPLLPFLLGTSAGAMIFAVIECFFDQSESSERGESSDNAEAAEKRRFAAKSAFCACFTAGFILMMSLDVLLG